MGIESFERHLKRSRKKNGDPLLASSIERYTQFISDYIDDLEKIKDSEKYIEYMNLKLHRRPSKVLYSAFNSYLRFIGYETGDPIFSKIKAPTITANSQNSIRFLQSKIMTPQEIKRLIDEAKGIYKVAIAVMYDSACRRSELLKLKWGDIIFFENPTNNIHAEVRLLGKGQKTRTVYLTKSTCDMLKEIYEEDPKKKIFVFYEDQENKKRILKKQDDKLYSVIKKLGKDVLGREVTPHMFRHSFSQNSANNGADVLGISNYLGHANLQTSQIYLKNSSAIGKKMFENFSKDIGVDKDD